MLEKRVFNVGDSIVVGDIDTNCVRAYPQLIVQQCTFYRSNCELKQANRAHIRAAIIYMMRG